ELDVAPAPAPAPAVAAAPAQPASGPLAQVAAVADEAAAARLWKDLSAAFPEPRQGKSMRLETVESGAHPLQRVLVGGFADADAASRFCEALQAQSRPCFLRKAASAQPPAQQTTETGKLRLAAAISDLRPSADAK